MAFENQTNETDEVFDFDGLGAGAIERDRGFPCTWEEALKSSLYIETVEGAGFKFNNPNMKALAAAAAPSAFSSTHDTSERCVSCRPMHQYFLPRMLDILRNPTSLAVSVHFLL